MHLQVFQVRMISGKDKGHIFAMKVLKKVSSVSLGAKSVNCSERF